MVNRDGCRSDNRRLSETSSRLIQFWSRIKDLNSRYPDISEIKDSQDIMLIKNFQTTLNFIANLISENSFKKSEPVKFLMLWENETVKFSFGIEKDSSFQVDEELTLVMGEVILLLNESNEEELGMLLERHLSYSDRELRNIGVKRALA